VPRPATWGEHDGAPGTGPEEDKWDSSMLQVFNRVWPIAVLALGFSVTLGWIGILGYGLLKLVI
jgi:hypothetical protein